MNRTKGTSFVLELEVGFSEKFLRQLSGKDIRCGTASELGKRFNAANAIYNTALGECLRRLHKMQHDLPYQKLCADYGDAVSKEDHALMKTLGAKIAEVRSYYGYAEYDMHAYIASCKRHFNLLGIDECQKLATRAFAAVEKVRKGEARKVRFHHWYDDTSIDGKSQKSTLRYVGNRCIAFGKENIYPLIVKKGDTYAEQALTHRVKYVRLVRRTIRQKTRYFAQLVMEGTPPKTKNLSYGRKNARVGLDEGTSTIAVVSKKEVSLNELAPGLSPDEKQLRVLNRAIDRSLRTMNPGNYNKDGTIRKGRKKWIRSNRCRRLEAKRRELHRVIADKRRCSHNALANHIVSLGIDIRVEDMRIRALAKKSSKPSVNKKNGRCRSRKRFGKIIMTRAPAMLISAIDRKLSYVGSTVKKVNTFTVKASQYDHKSDTFKKKQLSDRWHVFEDGTKVQRDLYSAFLVYNTTDDLQAIERSRCLRNYKYFKVQHDAEVQRIRKLSTIMLAWYVA